MQTFPQGVHKELTYCWIHCASAGEFEQAIPLINGIRKRNPLLKIAVSFFSPSGMEFYKNTDHADLYFYLPLDTVRHAKEIISTLRPAFTIFIRNEIWFNLLKELKKNNIPAYLVNARSEQQGNIFYRLYLEQAYPLFTQLFYTGQTGNTKLERVKLIAEEAFQDAVLQDFCSDSRILIVGSSRGVEEALSALFLKNNYSAYPDVKIIIAPHDYDETKYDEIGRLFTDRQVPNIYEVVSYTNYSPGMHHRVLFLDKKGILKYAYRYAAIAFIGGGYDGSIHNVSEAAVYGVPALFGPQYSGFEEVTEMVEQGIAFPVKDYPEFEERMKELLSGEKLRTEINLQLKRYFTSKAAASDIILDTILRN